MYLLAVSSYRKDHEAIYFKALWAVPLGQGCRKLFFLLLFFFLGSPNPKTTLKGPSTLPPPPTVLSGIEFAKKSKRIPKSPVSGSELSSSLP